MYKTYLMYELGLQDHANGSFQFVECVDKPVLSCTSAQPAGSPQAASAGRSHTDWTLGLGKAAHLLHIKQSMWTG
jgi:hypothetical protein